MQAINLSHKIFIKSLFFIMFTLVCYSSIWAQANNKRMLTPQDYHLWHALIPNHISSHGNWVSYQLYYEYTEKDTLIVQQTYGHKNYVFPNANTGNFNGETAFACLKKDTLIVLDLKSGKQTKTPGAVNYTFSANQKFMLVLLKQADQKFSLEVRDRNGLVTERVLDIAQYSFSSFGNGIFYRTAKDNVYRTELMLLKDSFSKKTISTAHKNLIKNFVWNENSIAFMELLEDGPKIFIYHILQDKLSSLDPKKVDGFPSQMKVSDGRFKKIVVSDDGQRVFFWLKENQLKSATIDPLGVEVWNTTDKQLIGSKKILGDYVMSDKLAVWNLKDSNVLQLTDKILPSGLLSADYNYAFTYDLRAYEPQTQQNSAYDVHLVDLKSGKRKRVIEKFTFGGGYIPSRSPDGKYLCYAKQGHWWIYDIKQDLHTVITSNAAQSFFRENTDIPAEDEPYGVGGWTKDGKIIIYDRYDLWKISLDGKENTRLTKGRKIQKTFRIEGFTNTLNWAVESKKNIVDLDKGIFLTTANKETGATGFSFWNPKSGVKDLVWKNEKTDQFFKAENKDIYMYVDQSFASPPRLMIYDGKTREVVRSNKQQDQFYWGKNEKIEYIVNGIKTKGVLFYPAGYDSSKKYPMVVSIYQRQFSYMHDYEAPSLINGAGNNVTNFTHQGYFVLYPDINYEFGNLKESVTKSVLSAVDAVVAKGSVFPNKIGLIGHSFGGYETDLIVTQTDRFAAAVAGAAWTDLVSAYLYFGQETLRPDFFRFESQQLRIGKSLFADRESYLKNSPVLLAESVKTPLLGWAGKDDATINSLQSMEFFLALRRASKEHILLIYPEDGHQLVKKENATDLSIRVMQWFDYYLKDGKKQDWMNSSDKR